MRLGLVAVVLNFILYYFVSTFPIGLETAAWYSRAGYAALVILAVIVLFAFRTSLGCSPLIAAPQLDD
jgi:hypothetical protein